MTDDNGNSSSSPLAAVRRYVPLAVWAIVILVVLFIPLRVKYGTAFCRVTTRCGTRPRR
jgi:hypothetical protein